MARLNIFITVPLRDESIVSINVAKIQAVLEDSDHGCKIVLDNGLLYHTESLSRKQVIERVESENRM